jgi:hypothetical protein
MLSLKFVEQNRSAHYGAPKPLSMSIDEKCRLAPDSAIWGTRPIEDSASCGIANEISARFVVGAWL